MAALCSVGDGNPVRAKGLCWNCYQQARRRAAGVPARATMPGAVTLPPLRIPAPLHEAARAAAEASGMSVSEWVRRAIAARLLDR